LCCGNRRRVNNVSCKIINRSSRTMRRTVLTPWSMESAGSWHCSAAAHLMGKHRRNHLASKRSTVPSTRSESRRRRLQFARFDVRLIGDDARRFGLSNGASVPCRIHRPPLGLARRRRVVQLAQLVVDRREFRLSQDGTVFPKRLLGAFLRTVSRRKPGPRIRVSLFHRKTRSREYPLSWPDASFRQPVAFSA
jgi:hypothetical protein